uniref:Uncharacterized protein n=1 Tax=viral metagenome TaxID=1070528 RepID=A0A6C0HY16_9ZZZZ
MDYDDDDDDPKMTAYRAREAAENAKKEYIPDGTTGKQKSEEIRKNIMAQNRKTDFNATASIYGNADLGGKSRRSRRGIKLKIRKIRGSKFRSRSSRRIRSRRSRRIRRIRRIRSRRGRSSMKGGCGTCTGNVNSA